MQLQQTVSDNKNGTRDSLGCRLEVQCSSVEKAGRDAAVDHEGGIIAHSIKSPVFDKNFFVMPGAF
ncbi:hypothetical protein [Noviherbaspirillum sp.]|uniref:hypothetical protein n=1 Tax=Noviherbaspirillum sp. TaxID=1926288 RepID=UPI002FDFCD77